MKLTPGIPPLSIAKLAERWEITLEEARRRVKKMNLPGFNVGTTKEPDWRFRLETIERWEADNERSLTDQPEAEPVAVKAGAPVAWDGVHRTRPPGKGAGPRRR